MAGIGQNAGGQDALRWRIAGWGGAVVLLALPFVAMQVTRKVTWTAGDFIVFGAMLLVAGAMLELGARRSRNRACRGGFVVAVAAAFLLVLVNLAVGFLGSEGNPANLMFAGVIAVAVAGSLFARFQAAGMARTMLATAVAQGLVGGIALAAGWASAGAHGVYEVVMGTGLFAALWLLSGWLFRIAAGGQGVGNAEVGVRHQPS